MSKNRVKIGLIGVRGHGEKIANAILKTSSLELAACCHPQKAVADEYAKKYGCRSAYNLENMLRGGEVGAVAIVTPNHLHYEQIKASINRKKHIFVEKPITNKLDEAREVIQKCRQNNLILMIGHNFRRNNAVRKIKEMLGKKRVGDFVSAEINMSHAGGMKFTPEKWRYYQDKCPGGPLMMLGIHAAEISNYLFGKAKRVAAIVKKLYAPTEAEDTSALLVELESGGTVYIGSNYNTPSTHFIRVYGTKGILEYNRNHGTLSFQNEDIARNPSPLKCIEFQPNDTLLEEMEEFGDCILQNKKPETSGEEAFNALAIVEAALISNREKKFMEVKKYVG